MAGEFWLSEAQWGALGPLLPKNQPGAREGLTTGGSSAASSPFEDRCETSPLISGVPAGGRLAADTAYDSDGLRRFLLERGTVPVIPNNPTRKRHHPFDETAYRQRNLIERMVCRLKHWRRIATRYDQLAANFAVAVMIAAVIIWWT